MTNVSKNTFVPEERHETIRRYIMALLEEYTLSAREIARYLKIPQKDVPNHIEHIKKNHEQDRAAAYNRICPLRAM